MAKVLKVFHGKGEAAAQKDMYDDSRLVSKSIPGPENREKDVVRHCSLKR